MYIKYNDEICLIKDLQNIRLVALESLESNRPEDILEREELEFYDILNRCDGCGCITEEVVPDNYGYNCCYKPCTPYSVRGLSPNDFL